MLFISCGMPRSASSFAYLIAYEIIRAKDDQRVLNEGLPLELRESFLSEDVLRQYLPILLDRIPNEKIYLIKSHTSLFPELRKAIRKNQIKAIFTYRDPIDIGLSLLEAGVIERKKSQDFQRIYFSSIYHPLDALKKLRPIMKKARTWLKARDSLRIEKILFSDITQYPDMIAASIGALLGREIDPVKIVEPYVSKKREITEFNIGLSGRGKEVLEREIPTRYLRIINKFNDQFEIEN